MINPPWTRDTQELWQRIAAHPFQGAERLDFHRRLCREQRWSEAYGLAVLEEYRRFVFLSTVETQSLTPSVDVDEAWHLHLTYTEDYWLTFCPKILGRALHHRPTTGSAADIRLYFEQYAQTLQIYFKWFGPPDRVIWPGSKTRFLSPGRFQRIHRDRYWVLRKPWR